VPLDHNNPQGDTIALTMARLRAPSESRLGSLIYNPGGPGGAGTTVVIGVALGEASTPIYSPELLKHYDIIGLDPRGVGLSAVVKCDPDLYNKRVSSFPTDEKGFQELIASNKEFAGSCVNLTGPLINHLDTISVVKDIELIRLALDDGKLNLLGQSYGTQIGEQYAELFPQNINRMVIDGIVDHSQAEPTALDIEVSLPVLLYLRIGMLTCNQQQAFESTLGKFFEWCSTSTDCALHGQDVVAVFDAVVDRAVTTPIPAPGCLPTSDTPCRADVTADELLQSAQGFLHVQNASAFGAGWATFSKAIAEAADGNATLLSSTLVISDSDALYSSLAITCQDWSNKSITWDRLKIELQVRAAIAPHTRGMSQTGAILSKCIGWPAPIVNPPHVLNSKAGTAPAFLMVNSFWDPSTSIVWANAVRQQMASAVFVARNGSGHLSYQLFGDTSKVMDEFLINGQLPEDGTIYGS
jgi:pimeloyl-ACP methyl ester carboxylesterase